MRIVLAHEGDQIAVGLAAALGGAHCMTPKELSRAGWVHEPTTDAEDTLSVDGTVVPARAITAVITRIAAVASSDLPHIVEADRGYVAAEMTAFLLSFLTKLACPVVNAPSAGSLMGPSWTPVRWRAVATRAGFAAPSDPQERGQLVVVVGDRCVGARSPVIEQSARSLAKMANVTLLGMRVIEGDAAPELVAVEPWSELPPAAIDSLDELLARGFS